MDKEKIEEKKEKIEAKKAELEKKKKEFENKEIVKKSGKFFDEFKEFIAKGNVLDLAVGVIIGGAFGKIVSSLVSDIIMPIIGMMLGGIDFTDLTLKVKDATITYGVFIQNIVDFLIIAICIFVFIKVIEGITKKKDAEEEAKEDAKAEKEDEQIVLLREIRDSLKK